MWPIRGAQALGPSHSNFILFRLISFETEIGPSTGHTQKTTDFGGHSQEDGDREPCGDQGGLPNQRTNQSDCQLKGISQDSYVHEWSNT